MRAVLAAFFALAACGARNRAANWACQVLKAIHTRCRGGGLWDAPPPPLPILPRRRRAASLSSVRAPPAFAASISVTSAQRSSAARPADAPEVPTTVPRAGMVYR